jgi:HD-GYP domain-containing protein (c-di-GMP phosphodiesterase class II)
MGIDLIFAIVLLIGGLGGGYVMGRKTAPSLPATHATTGTSDRALAYSERFQICNQWQTALAAFQQKLLHATTVDEAATCFLQAVRHEFADVQLLLAIGPTKDFLLLQTLASANRSHVGLTVGACFVSDPTLEPSLHQELANDIYELLKKEHATDTPWFLLRELQPPLQQRLSERYALQGQCMIVPLLSGSILCGILLLVGPTLAKNADTQQDHGRFASMGANIITTWLRCMAPQLLADTAKDPIDALPIHALASLSVLEQSASMLQENAESQEQVAELANYARAINEQDAEISLLATQTCQAIRRICQADFTLFLCPLSPEAAADFALYAVDAGSWSWSSFQGYAGIETHPQLDESVVKHWPDRFIAQMREQHNVIQTATRKESLLLAKTITETLSAETLLIVPAHIRMNCAAILIAGRRGPGGVAEAQVLVTSSVAALASMSLAAMRLSQQVQHLQRSATDGWKLASSISKQALATLAGVVQKQGIVTATNPQKVAEVAETIALQLRLPPAEVNQIRIAATVCDLGMVIIPQQILRKAGGLSDEETRLLHRHPEISVAMLEQFDIMKNTLPLILHHHERFDGTGYPKQLSGINIPRGAGIIAVADAYVHLQMERPYRPAISQENAIAYIKQESGKQFDPVIVQALAKSALQQAA